MTEDSRTREWIAGILALVLPYPERVEHTKRTRLDVPFWSMWIGLVEFVVGALWFVHDGLNFLTGAAERNASAIMENDPRFFQSEENAIAYMWSGSFNVLAWLSRPFTWLLISIVLVGMVRLVTFAASRDSSGEFFVWAFVRLGQLFDRQRQAAAQKARFGPERPDRILEEPGCDLLILSSSRQEEWNEYVTIEVDGRFYNVVGQEERRIPGEAWTWHAYKLKEQPENVIIRRLVRYEPRG